jgi:hypothetical protein
MRLRNGPHAAFGPLGGKPPQRGEEERYRAAEAAPARPAFAAFGGVGPGRNGICTAYDVARVVSIPDGDLPGSKYRASREHPSGDRWFRAAARRAWRNNGLSIVLFALFLAFWCAQIAVGFVAHNEDLTKAGRPAQDLFRYLASGHFLEATFENWESEFLQMALFVLLTVRLRQRGSSESKPPEEEEEPETATPPTRQSPWPVRRGGWVLELYAHSLSLALGALFFASFALHAWGGLKHANEEHVLRGLPPETFLHFVGSAEFWYQSFQNWQSEFLAVFSIVVLSIFLRERGSAQSKELTTPHHVNED